MNAEQFVDAFLGTVLQSSGAGLATQRAQLVALYNGTDSSRVAIIRRVADSQTFAQAEYNRAFVFTQYAGYLRRDPDMGGFLFWLGQINSGPLRDVRKQHAMVCSFITSAEYQNRFSSVVTHTNADCPQ